MIKLTRNYSLFALLAVAGALTGCGGGGSKSSGTSGVAVAGGIPLSSVTSTDPIAASSTASTVTISGTTVTIPASSAVIPASTPLTTIPSGTVFLAGTSLGAALSRAAGDVTVKHLGTGVSTTLTGAVTPTVSGLTFNKNLALYPGQWEITVAGPIIVKQGSSQLNVGYIKLIATVSSGTGSFPTSLTGLLPKNGTSTKTAGTYVSATIPGTFTGTEGTLTLYVSQGTTISKSATFTASGTRATASFSDLKDGVQIPSSGILGLAFEVAE